MNDLRDLIGRLGVAASSLSALGLALETKVNGGALAPEIRARLDDVIDALGVRAQLDDLGPAAARPLLGEIKVGLFHGLDRVRRAGRAPGWTVTDADVLQAAGEVSAAFPQLLTRFLPKLDGLGARLATGGRFLDVGVGVGVLAIEMARQWPALHVVGIDVWTPSLDLARDNLARAGLQDRIELRAQAAETLVDDNVFDLAWLPTAFIPGPIIPESLRRIHRALRPGGWVLLASVGAGSDPLAAALVRLRTTEWGAVPFTPPRS